MGQYINDVGPQRVFTLHRGILQHQGDNSIALAVWSADGETGGLGAVALEVLGNYATAPQYSRLGRASASPGRSACCGSR